MSRRNYGNVVWTNHALDRLSERRFSQEMALNTFNHPDKSLPGKQAGTKEYKKRFGKSWVTVIAVQNERGEWVILSCWIDPPFPGTADAKKREAFIRYRKAGFWKKLLLEFKYLLTGHY